MGNLLKLPSTRTGAVGSPGCSAHRGSVVLHLGAAHTGTRALRTWCGAHAERLAAHGIVTRADGWAEAAREEADTPDTPSLATWLRSVDTTPSAGRASRSFYSGAGGTGPVLDPATPGIYPRLAENLARVAEAGTGLDRHIQFAVADHAPFLESVYVRQVARGLALTFEEFLASVGPEPSWLPVVRTLVDVFGRDHVTVYDAAAPHPLGARLVEDAMTRLGAPGLGTSAVRERPLLPLPGRLADLSLAIRPYLRNDAERRAFRRLVDSGLSGADRPASFFTSERAAELSGRYAEDLRQIRQFTVVR